MTPPPSMQPPRLLKGLEEEVYTGTFDGEVVGMSHRVAAELEGYAKEPDCRNVEYTTPPLREYDDLGCVLMARRRRLREFLRTVGDYTLIPGATLMLDDPGAFQRSDPDNPYHQYIEQTYGTNVVTAGAHINVGLRDPELLLRAWRVIRMEAAAYLALSACSPFLGGKVTGYHSTRWAIFPKTPPRVPMFDSHGAYVQWVEARLADHAMQNTRHLWLSVRPNGTHAPYELQRLELRICDRLDDPALMLAVTALLEARLWQLIEDPGIDPLRQSDLTADELVDLAAANDEAASRFSLDAELTDWSTRQSMPARRWIERMIEHASPVAARHGFADYLLPLHTVLTDGNPAMRWLAAYKQGRSIRQIIQREIRIMNDREVELRQGCDQT